MEVKHTPGPWRFDDERSEIVGRPEWGCTRFRVKGEWTVASVETDCGPEAEVEANALLIATSPELLKALKPFAEYFLGQEEKMVARGGQPQNVPDRKILHGIPVGFWRNTVAAIAKATGAA